MEETTSNNTLDDSEMQHDSNIEGYHTQMPSIGRVDPPVVSARSDDSNYRRDNNSSEPYGLWQNGGALSVQSFRRDLENLIEAGDVQKAQDVLEVMEDLHKKYPKSPGTVKPDPACYEIILKGWAKTKRLELAESFLQRMEDMAGMHQKGERGLAGQQERSMSILPNVMTYTTYISSLMDSRQSDLAQRAEAVLTRMERHGVEPDTVAYTAVLACWSKAVGRKERRMAAIRAMNLLDTMEHKYIREEMYHMKPGIITYTTAISAIGNSLDPDAPRLVLEVLQRMYKLHKTGTIANVKPNTAVYNEVLYALSHPRPPPHRGTDRRFRRPVAHAAKAEQILEEMAERARNGEKGVAPDVRSWATVLRAWVRSGRPDAAEQAQRVLDKMDQQYQQGLSPVRPNYVCLTTVMGAWGSAPRSKRRYSRGRRLEHGHLQHSNKTDGSNSNETDSGVADERLRRVEQLLRRMEDGFEQTQEPDLRPNTVAYITAMDAMVRLNPRNAGSNAQELVTRMLHLYHKGLGHVRPTRKIFSTLIHAWSKSSENDGAIKAERIFQWMEEQYRSRLDATIRPDGVSLCAVLDAWANQGGQAGAERALQIWEHNEQLTYEQRGFHLTIAMPNIVIKALARSKSPLAVQQAEQILLRLEENYKFGRSRLKPDVTTYSSVINACAYYRGSENGRALAVQTALRTFYRLYDMEDERPNNITFGTLLKTIANLMPASAEKEDLVRTLFDQCCFEGQVDYFVLTQLRNASPKLYRELVEEPCGMGDFGQNDDLSIENVMQLLPEEWSWNVIE